MTVAERLIQKEGFDEGFKEGFEGFKEGFKKGALEWRGKQPAGCGIWSWTPERIRRRPDFPVKNWKSCFLMSGNDIHCGL